MRDAIIDFFRNKNIQPRDLLLFYYSGHGILDGYGDHYFATSALDPFEPDKEGLIFDEITRMINKSIAQRIITILDCCYSGASVCSAKEAMSTRPTLVELLSKKNQGKLGFR